MSESVAPELARLERVEPRSIWRSEPQDFTPRLSDNLDLVSEAIGIDLELPETEVLIGDFQADVVAAEVGTGRVVLVENQLDPTDHGHLGQLLTYAAGVDARALVWVSPQFRDEHRAALDWINRHTDPSVGVFGLELRV